MESPVDRPVSIIGTEEVTVDLKGRVLVSKEKRELLGNPCTFGVGLKGCLVLYSAHAWRQLEDQLDTGDALDIGADTLNELMMGEAERVEFDSQGRFVIPLRLRKLFKLENAKGLLIGARNKVEFWTLAEYEKYRSNRREYTEQLWGEISQHKFRMSNADLRGVQ